MGREVYRPHLTLTGPINRQPGRIHEPLIATISELRVGEHPFQCLTAVLDYGSALRNFLQQQRLKEPYFPHISLAYHLTKATAIQAIKPLQFLLGQDIVFDALWLVPVTRQRTLWRPLNETSLDS